MKKFIKNLLEHLEDYICTLLMIVMCVSITLQIIFRLIKHPLVWTMELATYSFIWVAFLSIAWAERTHSHFCVDVFTNWIHGKPRKVLYIVDDLIASGFYALLAYWAVRYFPLQASQVSSALLISKGWIEASMIVCFTLCLIHRLSDMIRTIRTFDEKEVKRS